MTPDKALLRHRFSANFDTYNTLAVVQEEICAQLDGLLASGGPAQIGHGLEIGAGTGFLTRRLTKRYPTAHWTVNDLADGALHYLEPYAENLRVEYLWGDAENLALPDRLDLIASASTIQWFDSLPAFLHRIHSRLKPAGTLALSTFGPENFREIKATTGEGLHYYSSETFQQLLTETGFEIVEWMEYVRQLSFDSPLDVLRHIRATGVNSIRPVRWTRGSLGRFETDYKQAFSTPSEEVTLTYHPMLAVARKI